MISGSVVQDLIDDTTMGDISDQYMQIVEIIGLDKFIVLSQFAMGEEIYIPMLDTILSPARERAVKREALQGRTLRELAIKYDLTIPRIRGILKEEPPPGQMDLEDWLGNEMK